MVVLKKKKRELKKQVNVKINNIPIDTVCEYKYLGVILNESLNYQSHIKMVKQKVNQRSYLLKKVRNITSHKETLTLYKSSILPFMDQGDLFFVAGNKTLLNSLQTMQNNCLRTVYGRQRWPGTQQAHTESKLMLLSDRRNLHLLKRAHITSMISTNLRQNNRHTLRSAGRLMLKEDSVYTEKFGKSYVVKSSRLWNSLPEEIKQIQEIPLFMVRVKREMLLNNLNFPE